MSKNDNGAIRISPQRVKQIIVEELSAATKKNRLMEGGVDHERAAAIASLAAEIAAAVAKIREKVAKDFPMLGQRVDGPLNELSALADEMQTNRSNPSFAAPKREKKTVILKPQSQEVLQNTAMSFGIGWLEHSSNTDVGGQARSSR